MDPIIGEPNGEAGAESQGRPDIMNDPAYDPNVRGKHNSPEEPDTCRICRGEGSEDEPLFYPCKCSGSIKFVHQNCLMEWLSHSQKKHCELCKTPFHFTKLYSPNMPNTVPLPIFLRKAAVHTWQSVVTSLRLLLVVFVWGFWLPWCMQTIWRCLFWIGDGAWANWNERRLLNNSLAYGLSSSLATEGTTPVEQGLLTSKEATASAIVAQISRRIPRFVPTADKLFSYSSGQPWTLLLFKKIYSYLAGNATAPVSASPSMATNVTKNSGPTLRSSWLSEFQFMKTLTPSTVVNNILIDTFEGQLITLFVVTAFILIFLIREWVVQQQPIINGGMNLNAQAPIAQAAPAPLQAVRQGQPVPEPGIAADHADEGVHPQGPRARMIARARPRRPRDPRRQSEQEGVAGEGASANAAPNGLRETEDAAGATQIPHSLDQLSDSATPDLSRDVPQRPEMPDRDASARVAEISRTIAELSRTSRDKGPGMEIFKDLWDRAGRDSSEVIKIIEQEGRSEELQWITAAMSKIEGLRQEAQVGQGSGASQTEDGRSHSINGSHSDTDEQFTLLERPLDNPSADAAVEGDTDKESLNGPIRQSSGALSTQLTHSGQVESASEQFRELTDPEQKQQELQSTEADPTATNTSSEGQSPGAPSRNSKLLDSAPPVGPSNGGADNPFHPDYEGDLPQASAYPEVGTPNEEPVHPQETTQSDPSSSQPNYGQAVAPPNEEIRGQFRTITETVTDWLWGGVAPLPPAPEQPPGDDEHIVNDIADEAPFVAIDHGQPLPLAANDGAVANQDPDVVAAAIQAGINPNEVDPAEEIEDLEGIMELIGMQGPLAGLVQNGMFCACLVSLTIIFGVWIPYLSGKLFLVLLAHPVSLLFRIPLRWAAYSADTIIDVFTFCAGCAFYWIDTIASILCAPIGLLIPALGRLGHNTVLADIAKSYAENALERLANTSAATGGFLLETDIPMFSLIAHESLQSIKTSLAWAIQSPFDQIAAIATLAYNSSSVSEFLKLVVGKLSDHIDAIVTLGTQKASSTLSSWPSLLHINPLRINVDLRQRKVPLDYNLAYWNVKDRALTVAFGYLFFALMGVVYLRLSSRMRGTDKNGRVVGGLADSLYQAGGVMKVVLIISIEMIVFPLYCGLLLDVALLPLFNNVTIMSRISFTLSSPNTSLFVHWFVGTCYMFHFALFVSMCRKILRSGVLYFIRDPDDPTFHPVRDVLERSVSTQLWKISFSALVYGGLVIVCLGGVVWGIAYAFEGVFPIHWSSAEPVLEFPLDLLFYNFLMPLAVKFFRPSKGLNKIFSWWFRKCARALRLTNFLFGEEKEDEEGRHVRRPCNGRLDFQEREGTTEEHFQRNGRYVRAPGSDQVRIPRGAHTFFEVDKDNNRMDGQPDSDDGLHGRKNEMFTKVYIPPLFRVRISAFVFLIWVFAAATGVSMTVVPLVFGRFIFASLAPSHLQMNDVYAFSIGIYILGGALYGILQHRRINNYIRSALTPHATTAASFLCKSAAVITRCLSLFYTYTAFGILLPALLSVLMEFYFIIPIHTYFSTTFASLEIIQSERHIVHLIQDWTLGVLYLKLAVRIILWNTPSRPATALRAIVRDGWLNPDVRLATRGFIIPATLVVGFALAAPLTLGWLANVAVLRSFSAKDDLFRACVYRYSYPGVLGLGFAAMSAWLLAKAFVGWRKKVRDEVYLIGERLHNFGEGRRRKGSGKGKGRAVVTAGPA